jgi:hypothetical protein
MYSCKVDQQRFCSHVRNCSHGGAKCICRQFQGNREPVIYPPNAMVQILATIQKYSVKTSHKYFLNQMFGTLDPIAYAYTVKQYSPIWALMGCTPSANCCFFNRLSMPHPASKIPDAKKRHPNGVLFRMGFQFCGRLMGACSPIAFFTVEWTNPGLHAYDSLVCVQ